MKIDILSLFPEMFDGFLKTSIIKRAIDKEVVDIQIHNFREFTHDKHNMSMIILMEEDKEWY